MTDSPDSTVMAPQLLIVIVGGINADLNLAVSHLPATGETVVAIRSWWSPGGKGANQAAAVARLGGRATLVGAIGDDDAAEIALSELEHVDLSHVNRVAHSQTGIATVCIDTNGDESHRGRSGSKLARQLIACSRSGPHDCNTRLAGDCI